MIEIPTNTAIWIAVGPFLDKGDGITPELSITVANSATTLIADATAESAPTIILDSVAGNDGTNTLTHITNDDGGYYYLKLSAANNNRYGHGKLIITDVATYVPVFHEIQWVSAQYYNMKYSTTILDTNVTKISGDSDAADNCELMFDGTGYAGGTAKLKIDVETIKTQAVTCAAGVTVLASVGAPAAPGANGGLPTTNGTKLNQTADLTAGQSIACSDKTGFSLAATGADLILKSSTFIQAIVAAVNEFATYGLTALNTLLVTTGIRVLDFVNDAIAAAAVKADAVTKIQNGLATPTNITAGTITTVTNLTNAPTNGDFTAAMKSSITAAVPSAATIGTDAASKVLVTPAQKIVTDASGYVTYSNTAPPSAADIKTAIEAAGSSIATILADLTNGGRLDLIFDGIKAKTDNLPSGISKNTALSNFEFLMVLATDHITPATGKTFTSTRSIDGAAFGACANAATEVGSGVYKISLAAADLNGDFITLKFSEAACDTRYIMIKTVTA